MSKHQNKSRKIKRADTNQSTKSLRGYASNPNCAQNDHAHTLTLRVGQHVNIMHNAHMTPGAHVIVLEIAPTSDVTRIHVVYPKTKNLMRAWFDLGEISPVVPWTADALAREQVVSRENRSRQCSLPGKGLITVDDRLF